MNDVEKVVKALKTPQNKAIPSCGGQTVNLGDLTLVGGWGTSVRKMGLAYNNFDAVEPVTAEGDCIKIRMVDKGKYRDVPEFCADRS